MYFNNHSAATVLTYRVSLLIIKKLTNSSNVPSPLSGFFNNQNLLCLTNTDCATVLSIWLSSRNFVTPYVVLAFQIRLDGSFVFCQIQA